MRMSFAALFLLAIDQLADASGDEGRVEGHGGGGRSAGFVLVPSTPLRCRAGEAVSGCRECAVVGDISFYIIASDLLSQGRRSWVCRVLYRRQRGRYAPVQRRPALSCAQGANPRRQLAIEALW